MPFRRTRFAARAAATLCCLAAVPAGAQRVERAEFVPIGGEVEERARLEALLAPAARDAVLLRSFSRSLQPVASGGTWVRRAEHAGLVVSYASALPAGGNDGALRAARGLNVALTGGAEFQQGRLRIVAAPQLLHEQNRPFQVIPFPQDTGTTRSIWANPFHPLPESIDLPLRFGDESHWRIDPGQSSVTVQLGRFEVGAATENLWWGPGVRNAIVLSNNAAGFPHLLARPLAPLPTRIGLVSFDAIAGRLGDSGYFESGEADGRSLLGGAVVWQRDSSAGLRLGASRLRIGGASGSDALSSLFGRWVFAPAGFEAYVEWARFQDPASLRDLLEFPTRSQGYTYGLQWARRLRPGRTVRIQTELTYLEPSAELRLRPEVASYTSSRVPAGFTQRGEVLGAAIGPASSSQWIAVDLFGTAWRAGAFAGRTRNDNAALFSPVVPPLRNPDVTVQAGLRLASDVGRTHLSLQLTDMARLNYLYQSGFVADPAIGGFQGIDITNRSLTLTVTPALGR